MKSALYGFMHSLFLDQKFHSFDDSDMSVTHVHLP